MKGFENRKNQIRRQVFKEVATLAYDGWDDDIFENLQKKIIPDGPARFRDSIDTERWIVEERLRSALGLPLREGPGYHVLKRGELRNSKDVCYKEPFVDVVILACNACPEERMYVTDVCQNCLDHSCIGICPKDAIHIEKTRAVIDDKKCVKCGLCQKACNYSAIVRLERPCKKACGMGAISTDEYGTAVIDHEKCVSCGMCMVSCPFGAIVDKSPIFQVITAMVSGVPVYAAIAPSFAGNFGNVSNGKLRAALKALGFADVYEVAVGADICTEEETQDFLNKVPYDLPFMATSCCPAWTEMIKREFPEFEPCISMTYTPMVLTAQKIKEEHPEGVVVFIGPCAAKKAEASQEQTRQYVDYVLTFEEVAGMMESRNISVQDCEEEEDFSVATGDGIGFAVSGGVANAVLNHIQAMDEGREVSIQRAEGLADCRQLMQRARAGQCNGCLVEGMACPGGCVGGAGMMVPITKATAAVQKMAKNAK